MSQAGNPGATVWTFLELVFDQWMSLFFQRAFEHRTDEPRSHAPLPPAPDPSRPPALQPPQPPAAAPSPPLPDAAGLIDLDDDFVKLVAFSIVSVRRGYERYVKGGSEVVSGRMSEESFVSWMIAKNVQEIDPGEEKYLRVHYTVARRWPREPLDFEENQLRHLDGIRRALAGEPSAS